MLLLLRLGDKWKNKLADHTQEQIMIMVQVQIMTMVQLRSPSQSNHQERPRVAFLTSYASMGT